MSYVLRKKPNLMDDIFKSVLVEAAGISVDHPLAAVLSGRSEVMRLTQNSHDAALKPEPSGGLSHAERATLACRMARLNDEEILAGHYEAMVPVQVDALFLEMSFYRWKADQVGAGCYPTESKHSSSIDSVSGAPRY